MVENAFPSRVNHVTPGSRVDAGNIGRTTRQLSDRTNYLREVLDAVENGQFIVHREVTVEADAEVGMPVYWDADAQEYRRGLAGAAMINGAFTTLESSDIIAQVWTKHNSTLADVVIHGLVRFKDLSNVIEGEITPGRYYLSATTPGKIVRQKPPVSVFVGVLLGPLDACDENTWFLVQPTVRDFLEDHIHYHFKLVPLPAGNTTPPAAGERHEITNPDSDLQGWLPADDPIFGGNAPAGAVFGYNLSQQPSLDQVFPPIPVGSSLLQQFKPDTRDTLDPADPSIAIPQTGGQLPDEKVIIDKFGIWWMTDCWAEVPWPTDLDAGVSSLSSVSGSSSSSVQSSSSSSGGVICPLPSDMALDLYFTKMTFATDKTVVTSLQPAEGQPIEYVNCEGEAANTGDLFTKLLLALLIDDDEFFGGEVLKTITPENTFGQGFVTEGLVAGSSRVSLTSSHQRRLTPGDPSTPLVHQEIVVIDLNVDPTERELNPQIIRLGDAKERAYKGITYIGFPDGRDSGVRIKFNVASEGLPLSPKLMLRATMFGRLTGTMTDMEAGFYRLDAPDPTTPIVEGDTPLAFDTAVAVTVDEAVIIESEEFDVEPGDTVFVSLNRLAAGAPTYSAEMGIIRVVGVITSGL